MKKFVSLILIAFMLCLTGCNSDETPETHEYKVVSVYQYIKIETNTFGAVTSQELAYCFTYIDGEGQLHQFDGFRHTEYGLWKLCIGNENKYVVKEEGLNTYRFLYLTEETLASMSNK